MPAIHSQLSTLSALDWASYTTFHTLCYRKMMLIVCQKGINEFEMLSGGFKAVEIIKLYYVVPG
jgi:hypothetical protein